MESGIALTLSNIPRGARHRRAAHGFPRATTNSLIKDRGEYNSGTEHEFRLAYKAWQRQRGPHIMVYFNQRPYAPRTRDETDQWGEVLDFQRNFPKEGLWWPFRGRAQYERLVRNHLTQCLCRQENDATGPQRIPSEPPPPASVQQYDSGATASGSGATAAGAGGIAVGGNVYGNIVSGPSAMPEPPSTAATPATAQIFLCYARQDEEAVRALYQRLSAAGFKPWMDQEDIYPGEQWQRSIDRAIARSGFLLGLPVDPCRQPRRILAAGD